MRLPYQTVDLQKMALVLDVAAIIERMREIDPVDKIEWPPMDNVEEWFFLRAFMQAKGNQSETGRLLGVSRYAVRYRMGKFNAQKYICGVE